MDPPKAGLFGAGHFPQGEINPTLITAWGLAMNLWTFTMQASMCCMVSWMRACHQGMAFAHSFAELPRLPMLGPPRPPADILPFPAVRATRGGRSGGPGVVIPIGRR
ncbi:hypothetical protein [Azospirillum endophyticum]